MSTKITIEAIVSAAPEKVWEFWNKADHVQQWNSASDDWWCPRAENDLRVGGKFNYRMEAKDKSFGFDFEGVYDQVDPLKRISYTMPDKRTVVTTFENVGGKTKITTVFDAENQNPMEMQKEGWQSILNKFKGYVESN